MFQVSKKQRLSPSTITTTSTSPHDVMNWCAPSSTNPPPNMYNTRTPELTQVQAAMKHSSVAADDTVIPGCNTGGGGIGGIGGMNGMNLVHPLYPPNINNHNTTSGSYTTNTINTTNPVYYHRKRKQTTLTNRYNATRPNYKLTPRVSLSYYPDPTMYGNWHFTGSNIDAHTQVEYYEKEVQGGIVKLDFWFTVGLVKTEIELFDVVSGTAGDSSSVGKDLNYTSSLGDATPIISNGGSGGSGDAMDMDCSNDSSNNGGGSYSSRVIQLYSKGKQLLPDVYKKILQNPLVHTDARYQRQLLH